jgi:homoserine kinase
MKARVPASSANLGPGYDVLALALGLYTEVTVEAAQRLVITAEGEGAELPKDSAHLAAVVVRAVLGHDDVAIHVRSEIPVGRGLGSSAALAVAAAAAAGAEDPLTYAAEADGHAENAAASLLGGLVAAISATSPGGTPVARRLPLDPELEFVVVVPDRTLATTAARSVLPATLTLEDAVFGLGRMGLLLAGLADRTALVPEAGDDRIHQDARAALFPEAPLLLARLKEAGAVVSCWSGAGPSLLGICDPDRAGASSVREGAERALEEAGLPGRVLLLAPDRRGLVLER